MALINCPACRREISEAAPSCPGCGHPRAATQLPNSPAPTLEPQRVVHQQSGSVGTGFGGGFGCVLGAIVAIILLVVVLAVFNAAAKCENCTGTGRTLGGLVQCPKCEGRGYFGK